MGEEGRRMPKAECRSFPELVALYSIITLVFDAQPQSTNRSTSLNLFLQYHPSSLRMRNQSPTRFFVAISVLLLVLGTSPSSRNRILKNGTNNDFFALGFSVVPQLANKVTNVRILQLSRLSSEHPDGGERPSAAGRSNLGINLGKDYSLALNATDREELQIMVCRQMIHERISEGILDLQLIHDKWERDIEEGLVPLEQAMTLNTIRESKKFATRVDSMVGTFWNQTARSRQKTHDLFHIDELEQKAKAKEEEERKSKKGKGKRRPGDQGTAFQTQSWKKTNDAWDDWDSDDW
jgi:hypothetical protein